MGREDGGEGEGEREGNGEEERRRGGRERERIVEEIEVSERRAWETKDLMDERPSKKHRKSAEGLLVGLGR